MQELVDDSLLATGIYAQITLCAFTAWTIATCGHLDAQDEQVSQTNLLGQKIPLEACIGEAQSVIETFCSQQACHDDSGQQWYLSLSCITNS